MKRIIPGLLQLSVLLLLGAIHASSQNITITDCNLKGWEKQPMGSSSLAFVNGPGMPPLGKGSMKLNVPPGIYHAADYARFKDGEYNNTPLSSLTSLSYSTYIESRDTAADAPFLVMQVDSTGVNDSSDDHLVFDPRYQNPKYTNNAIPNQAASIENAWQKWDCFHGGWFAGTTVSTDPDHNGHLFTLDDYIKRHPNARIKNDPAKNGNAIRLSAGGGVFKANFYGEVDDFEIGVKNITTVYDFEFTTANAGADKNMTYGYGPLCTILNGSASGGEAPYNYSWLPGGATPTNNSTEEVCPTATTKYTLTVIDKNGCTGTDDLTIIVKDVRCGDGSDKVSVCHKGTNLCVAKDAVQAHLKHGDNLGSCDQKDTSKSQ
jgi:hypothetical protein